MIALLSLKESLLRKYNMKNIEDVKTIIGWQVTRDLDTKTLKIYQSAYIWDLLEEKNLIDCNALTILMKARSVIEINKPNYYNKANLAIY